MKIAFQGTDRMIGYTLEIAYLEYGLICGNPRFFLGARA